MFVKKVVKDYTLKKYLKIKILKTQKRADIFQKTRKENDRYVGYKDMGLFCHRFLRHDFQKNCLFLSTGFRMKSY